MSGRMCRSLMALLLAAGCEEPTAQPAASGPTQAQLEAARRLPMCERAVAVMRLNAEMLREQGIDAEAIADNVTRVLVREGDRLVPICPEVDEAAVDAVIRGR